MRQNFPKMGMNRQFQAKTPKSKNALSPKLLIRSYSNQDKAATCNYTSWVVYLYPHSKSSMTDIRHLENRGQTSPKAGWPGTHPRLPLYNPAKFRRPVSTHAADVRYKVLRTNTETVHDISPPCLWALWGFWKQTSAMLEFYFHFPFYVRVTIGMSFCICLPNFVQIGASATELWRHIHFQDGRRQPYWIISRLLQTTHEVQMGSQMRPQISTRSDLFFFRRYC